MECVDYYTNLEQNQTPKIELHQGKLGEETGTNIYPKPDVCQALQDLLICIKSDNFVAASLFLYLELRSLGF